MPGNNFTKSVIDSKQTAAVDLSAVDSARASFYVEFQLILTFKKLFFQKLHLILNFSPKIFVYTLRRFVRASIFVHTSNYVSTPIFPCPWCIVCVRCKSTASQRMCATRLKMRATDNNSGRYIKLRIGQRLVFPSSAQYIGCGEAKGKCVFIFNKHAVNRPPSVIKS